MTDKDMQRAKDFALAFEGQTFSEHLEGRLWLTEKTDALISQIRDETLEDLSVFLLEQINSVAADSRRGQAEQVALIAKYSFARGQVECFKTKKETT